MNTRTKSLSIGTMLSAALFLTLSASQASVETAQAPNGATVTKIRMNGRFAAGFLSDGDTNGIVNASTDQITNTSALEFRYAISNAPDPDHFIFIHGAGEIPNSAFTVTSTSAHLAVTTPFPVERCVVEVITLVLNCAPTTPITFDLTWVRNGVQTVFEKTKRIETFGPLTTKFHGDVTLLSATFTGTWDVYSAATTGNLVDTQNTTVIREVTLEPNP